MKYIFYDTDITGNEEYDIAGEAYTELIQTCCKYCKYISFIIMDKDTAFLKDWTPYQIYPNPGIPARLYSYYVPRTEKPDYPCVKYYAICAETQQLLISMGISMFQFIYGWGYKNLEDPVFYREDGSVFFSATIHEGECTLFPRQGEEIDQILDSGGWIQGKTQYNHEFFHQKQD